MVHVKFKNLEKSEFVYQTAIQRVSSLEEKFPALKNSRILLTLEMENSPSQPGPDSYKVQLFISRGKFHGIVVKKTDSNLYRALADLIDHMLEKLNRAGDRERVKNISKERKFIRQIEMDQNISEPNSPFENIKPDKFSA